MHGCVDLLNTPTWLLIISLVSRTSCIPSYKVQLLFVVVLGVFPSFPLHRERGLVG